ncbi:hypothetical protein M0802_014668 [Mischocyttarus mexicanus]|nr:hypothetical protein M0802_014668 [Mischocyttarus mexicanus]
MNKIIIGANVQIVSIKCSFIKNRIGSPPPNGSKKDVLIFRSVNNIVIAPASTGKDNKSKIAVIKTDHVNIDDKGGYKVHPVPTPESFIFLIISSNRDGGNNQNLMLFIRGNAISGAPNIRGINQFPNPPIINGVPNSKRIINLKDLPIIPDHNPKIKYKVPISL